MKPESLQRDLLKTGTLLTVAMLMGWAGPAPAEPQGSGAETRSVEDGGGAAGSSPAEGYLVEEEVFVEGLLPDIPTSNTVAAKLPLSLQDTPASVSVVPTSLTEEQRGFVLGDALENVSGVNVQTGNGVFDYFVIRGLDSVSSGLILTDGAPEPETTFYQLYNVDRVEVLKGPSAFLYGGSPLGGTVNLVRKQPRLESFTRIAGYGGSFGTFETTVDANQARADGKLAFRLNGLYQQSDGYRDDKKSDNLAFNPAVTWRPDDDTVVTFNAEWVETEYSTDGGLPLLFDGTVADVPRTRSYQSPLDTSDQEILRLQLDVERRFGENFTLRNKTYYRGLDWLSRGTALVGAFPGQTGRIEVSRTLLDLDDRQRFAGNQLEGLWQLEGAGVTHSLLVGWELSRQTDEFSFGVGFLPSLDLLDPRELDPLPVFPIPGQAFGADAETVISAPYAVDQISFSEHFKVLLGLRYDAIDFEDSRNGADRSFDELSPMVGVVVSPTPELSFYASAGDAFAAPSTFVAGARRVPEESRQIEVGVKQKLLDDRLHGTLAFYRIDRDNIAIPDANGVTRQTGDQRSQGVELELVAAPAPGWKARLAYAYNDAELTEFRQQVQVALFPPVFVTLDLTGNRPAFAPEHILDLWVSKSLPGGWGVAGGGRWVSEQFIAENNAFAIDGYATFDAAVFYDLAAWRFQLNLKNLTDEDYYTRGFGDTSVIPAPGIAAYGGVEYRF